MSDEATDVARDRTPTFRLERDAEGQWQGNFYGANGELVWWTESYPDRDDAEHAVDLLRQHATTATIEVTER